MRHRLIRSITDFTVVYRGYDLEVARGSLGWLVGVHPRTADLPILRCSEVCAGDPDRAVVAAKHLVDGVLRL